MDDPIEQLKNQNQVQVAHTLDAADELRHFRDEFHIPTLHMNGTKSCIYLCGNSLGLQPKSTKALVMEELEVWATHGVDGHHTHPKSRPWVGIDETVTEEMAKIVGALPSEVAVMGTLTSNIHFLMAAFYKPSQGRHRILVEDKAFPSDYYAVESQVKWHGLEPSTAIVTVKPRDGSHIIDTNDILGTIDQHKDSLALILLSGVQYYTGQLFKIEEITKYAKERGIIVGWDLAHAAGNVLLKLHEWNVDFAAWCSYKYLNSGPGGIAAIFVHEGQSEVRRLAGWWGHDKASRFDMENRFQAIPGAAGFQHSNPSVVATICLLGSLRIFSQTTMDALTTKSRRLTGYLEKLLSLDEESYSHFEIITPKEPLERGAQLSILFKGGIMQDIHRKLELCGIVVDERKPDVIRVAPTPLYNTYEDVLNFTVKLKEAIEEVTESGSGSKAT